LNAALQILKILAELYPNAGPELHFTSPFETLVATILSAQCTDRQVNKVTPALFAAFPSAAAIAPLEPSDLEPYIRGCGVYHNKAKNIVLACRLICEKFGGEIPKTLEELQSLPGVGRKTANVVYANAFGGDAIAVDTHVFRVSNRLGLAHAKDVLHTELELQKVIPKADWSKAHHWLIWHGRRVCAARSPKCEGCALRSLCEHDNAQKKA
jgi:endonuclease-3